MTVRPASQVGQRQRTGILPISQCLDSAACRYDRVVVRGWRSRRSA